jgi:Holliday junction resolvase
MMSRRKGCQGEREAAAELRRLFGVEAYRGRQYHGGPDAPDVRVAIPGIHVEVKRAESLRLYPSLYQAIADAGDRVAMVLYRANRQPWVVILRLEDLPRLVEQIDHTLRRTSSGSD